MDSEILAHPGVAHIPSILEHGELPEAITFASGKAMVLVATDQRVVTVQITYDIIKRQHSVRKVTSHQHRDMTSFDAQHGFMAAGFVMVDANGKRKIIAARKLGRDGFASVVSAHLMPAAPTPARKRADPFSGMPFWQKIISVPLSIAVLVAAVGAVWFVGETAWGWWQGNQAEAEACRLNDQCWGGKHHIKAETACTPAVERQARYDHDWTDGWEGWKFTTWHFSGDVADGIIQYRGGKVKFQNAFGVWAPMVYGCYYNTETESVVGVVVEAR